MFSVAGFVNYFFHDWIDSRPWVNFHMHIGIALSSVLAGEFSSVFLRTRRIFPRFHLVKRTVSFLALLGLLYLCSGEGEGRIALDDLVNPAFDFPCEFPFIHCDYYPLSRILSLMKPLTEN